MNAAKAVAARPGQSTIAVNCSSGVPYTLSLNAGIGSGASVGERYMTLTR
jgi:spore coat protein U-like protein